MALIRYFGCTWPDVYCMVPVLVTAMMVAGAIVLFVIGYVIFQRQEVRA